MNIDSERAIRKWKAREDQHLSESEVRSHGVHDTGNLRGKVVSKMKECKDERLNADLHL